MHTSDHRTSKKQLLYSFQRGARSLTIYYKNTKIRKSHMNDFTWRDEGTYICASASPNAVNNGPLSPCVPPVKKSSLATYPRLKRRAVDLLLANLVTVQFSLMQPCPTKPLIFCIADSGRAVQSTVFAVSVLPVMSYSVNDVCAVLELRYVCLCRSPGICMYRVIPL